MIEKYLNNRIYILYVIPFTIGLLTVLSFQPFNLIFINFFILPIVFYVIVHIKKKSKSTYRKKPYKKNLFIFGTTFGFGFYLGGIHWITNSLTFDDNFKILKELESFQTLNRPIIVGLSRKSMIYKTLSITPEESLNGTTALNILALERGANILRVHDAREALQCINLLKKLN